MVKDKPAFVEAKDVFQEVVNGYINGYLVAHNHFYDKRVLERHGIDSSNHSWICTWRLSKKIFSDIEAIKETNLPYLRFALDLDVPLDLMCHRAGNDSFITGRLLEIIIDILEENGTLDKNKPYGPQIKEYAESPIIYKKFPFGKHQGVALENIPKNYWTWAMNNTDWFNDQADNYDPDLAASINAVL
jgi:DNA polymerase III epsilon subunit-like protein